MKRYVFSALVFLCLLVIQVDKATSAPITGLYNTGIGEVGTVDPHYTIPGLSVVIGKAPGEGVIYWQYPSNPQAQWVYLPSPNPDFNTFSLTFNLTGYDYTTASFSALWMMDNAGYVKLNGVEIPGSRYGIGGQAYYQYLNPNAWGFSAVNATSFSNAAYFQAGVNILEFVVLNGGGPTGIYVEFTESNITPMNQNPRVPEPVSMLLLGLGFMGVAGVRRMMKK